MALGIGSGLHAGIIDSCGCEFFKAVYSSNQSSQSGVKMTFVSGLTDEEDDYWVATFDIYLTGSSDTFDAGTDDVTMQINMGARTVNKTIAQNTLVSVTATSTGMNAPYSNDLYILFQTSSDYPDAGATFYIRNLKVDLKDDEDNIKKSQSYDFSECGDLSVATDYSIGPGTLAKSIGNCLP
jgi:hypothetical protein